MDDRGPSSLLCLEDHCLEHIYSLLHSTADKHRLSRVCRPLHEIFCKAVRHICATQQDLENYDETALSVFPHARILQLHSVELNCDFTSIVVAEHSSLLQQLVSMRITSPCALDGHAVALLLQACPALTSLETHGDWQCGDDNHMELLCQRPHKLQRLSLQHNSHMSPADLVTWLSVSTQLLDVNTAEATASRDGSRSNRESSSNVHIQLQQLLAKEEAAQSAGMQQLQPAWTCLQHLDLSGCNKIGGSLGFLAFCPELQSLALHSCYKVTNSTLEAFNKALHSGSSSRINGSSCAASASGSCHPISALPAPAAASTSGALVVTGNSSGNSYDSNSSTGAATLALTSLDLSYTRVSDGGMPHLVAALPQLQRLCLKGCNVGDDGLEHLLALQHLTSLHIKHCHRVTEEGVEQLSVLSQLQELSYGYTSLPEADEVAGSIASQFKGLTALDLLSSELTDKGLAAIGQLQQLQLLKLYQAGVTTEGLALLAEQPAGQGLSSLVLYGLGQLTELACLQHFPSLQQLQLGGLCDLANVPDAVKQLGLLPKPRSITLERIDGITVQCLQHVLSRCKQLQDLRVRGCDGVSQEDMEQLAVESAAECDSSSSIWWAASPSVDTDDEDDGWMKLEV